MNLVWHYVRKYKNILFGAVILAAINQFFSLLDPQIIRVIVDRYASHSTSYTTGEFLSGVGLLVVAFVGVSFISRVAKNFQDYFVNIVSQRVGASIYETSISHSFLLPYAIFEDQRSGELLLKLQKARTDIQIVISNFVNIIFFSLIGMIFVLSYAFYVHWLIGAVYFLMIPTLGVTTFLIGRRIKSAQRNIVLESADLAGSTTETLRNVELVKSLGLESQEIGRLNSVNEKILSLELKKIRLIRVLSFIQGTMINAMRAILIFLMIFMIFKGHITLGEFLSLFIYSFFIFSPLSELGNVSSQFHEARASSEQLNKILEIPTQVQPKNPLRVGPVTSIEFKDVSFSYASSGKPSLQKASLQIKAGDIVAFVGPSGSGKTTLVKLIVGLYQPQKGKILFNQNDSSKIDYADLRKRIGLVSQETQLFAGAVRENLLFVNPQAKDEDCLQALKSAAATPIIERGGKGLDTKIGEGGIKISGGERQRLAIARALLRNPEIIIFDEATSSLDSITEKSITQTIRNISNLRPNLITILIAHRLSTVAHAKKIYVLEKGLLSEEGNHAELLKEKGLYAALWREQSGSLLNES
ncbi:MAG: ABC transporter ATP-binding protein [Candidatus Liptonbacteria bacterium]|nr:ABC transporter ATP-binding protein [Candidatus Liptonbacteria bacterium]